MKILFVCLGNICRSPLAEGILKDLCRKEGLNWTIESAGTNRWHKGGPADPRTIEVARNFGLDLSAHIARRFQHSDFANYDRIYSMAFDVTEEIRAFARSPEDMRKVLNFMDALEGYQDQSVPDPWYGGPSDFEKCFRLIEEACRRIVKTPSFRPSPG